MNDKSKFSSVIVDNVLMLLAILLAVFIYLEVKAANAR